MAGVQFLAGARDFSLLHSVQTGSGNHPTSYPMGAGTPSLGVKRPGCEADHYLLPMLRLKMVELYRHSSIYLHGIVLN
jgi:hypothetical protein